jgi:hypothetical protein
MPEFAGRSPRVVALDSRLPVDNLSEPIFHLISVLPASKLQTAGGE